MPDDDDRPDEPTSNLTPGRRPELRADCASCFGLCCVALAFERSADFAIDKDAGDPCVHLDRDDGCEIHPRLRESGFRGCSVFDCFGAGQQVSQVTFGGRSWRDEPKVRDQMFAVLPVMRQLHELLWYLDAAARRASSVAVRAELEQLAVPITMLSGADPATVMAADVPALREGVRVLLRQVSAQARNGVRRGRDVTGPIGPGADLLGAALAGADLAGSDLRGAYLIAADLRGADLHAADLIGADLRDADLSGADLSESLFLTQPQVDAARGDARTVLPTGLHRPAHWAR